MIELFPMTEAEFVVFCEQAIPLYAAEKVLAGSWTLEESLQRSQEAYAELLPQGVETVNHFLFTIREVETGAPVGVIWWANDAADSPRSGFIYELSVKEAHRRKGYGWAAMRALEMRAKALRIDTLRLHVFGQNRIAQSLYEKLGYEVTDLNMARRLT